MILLYYYYSFYCSYLWLLTSKRCCDICFAWWRALRKSWNIPFRTYNKILAFLSNTLPIEMRLEKYFIKCSNNVLNHSTGIIKSVASVSLYNPWSTFSRNYNYYANSMGRVWMKVFKIWHDIIGDVVRADIRCGMISLVMLL